MSRLGAVPALVLVAAWVAGCGRPSLDTFVPPPDAVGVYDYTASVSTSQGGVLLQGRIEVAPDTLLVSVDGGDCLPIQASVRSFTVSCHPAGVRNVANMRFSFERTHPLRRPRLSVYLRFTSEEQVCERYQTTTEGRVCISWSVRTTTRNEHHAVQPRLTPRTAGVP